MKNVPVLLLGIILLSAATALSDVRTQVDTPPRIGDRAVRRLLLVAPVKVNDSSFAESVRFTIEIEIKPGSFSPVSEDRRGTYYQASPGLVLFRSYQPISGGIYVLKGHERMVAYVGDARVGSRSEVRQAKVYLSPDQMRAFHPEYVEPREK